MKDGVFVIRVIHEKVWKAVAGGKLIAAEFNSKGAALAAIDVEKRRQAKPSDVAHQTGKAV